MAINTPSRYTLRRQAKKQQAAEHYGVPIEDLIEVREWVPKSRADKVRKYVKRLRK